VRLDVGAIIAGAHVDAAFRGTGVRGRRAVGVGFGGIEHGGIVGFQVDQRQVDGRAGGMAGMLGDIAQPEQIGLAEGGVIPPLGSCLPAVLRPYHHVMRRARRPVAVQHFQRQVPRREFLLDALERKPDVALHQTFGSMIARERPADEIIEAGIADVLNDGGIDLAQEYEAAGQGLGVGCACKHHRC